MIMGEKSWRRRCKLCGMEHTIFPKTFCFPSGTGWSSCSWIRLFIPIWNMATNLLFWEIYFTDFSGMARVPHSEKNTECSMLRMKSFARYPGRWSKEAPGLHSVLTSSSVRSVLLYSASLFPEQSITVLWFHLIIQDYIFIIKQTTAKHMWTQAMFSGKVGCNYGI